MLPSLQRHSKIDYAVNTRVVRSLPTTWRHRLLGWDLKEEEELTR